MTSNQTLPSSNVGFESPSKTGGAEVPRIIRDVISLLGIFTVFYAVELVSFNLSIDEEKTIFRTDATEWIQQGRWLIYLIERFVLPHPVIPFLPLCLFGLCLATSYILLLRALHVRCVSWRELLAFIPFAAFPTWLFIVEFQLNTPATGLGVLLSTYTAYLLARVTSLPVNQWLTSPKSIRTLLSAITCGALAVGAYQSNATLMATFALILTFLRATKSLTKPAEIAAQLGIGGAAILLSVAAYYVVQYVFMAALNVPSSGYVESMFRPNLLFSSPVETLASLAAEISMFYSGHAYKFSISTYSILALTLVGLWSMLNLAWRIPNLRSRVIIMALVIPILLVPFSINLFAGGRLPTRALVALPTVFWLFAYTALSQLTGKFRAFTLVVLAALSFQTLYIGNMRQAISALVRDYQIATAAALYERILEAQPSDFDLSTPIKVEFYGAIPYRPPYPRSYSTTTGKTFFSHDNGSPLRIFYYLNLLGYSNIQLAYPVELHAIQGKSDVHILAQRRAALIPHFEKMPVWPARGSVRRHGDVTLVRLNQIPGSVYDRAPRPAE